MKRDILWNLNKNCSKCNNRLILIIDQFGFLFISYKRRENTSVMKCAHTHGGFGHTFTIFPPWDFCRPRTNTHYAPPAHVADVPFYVYSRMRFLPRFPTIRQFYFYPSPIYQPNHSLLSASRSIHNCIFTITRIPILPNYSTKSFVLSKINKRKEKIESLLYLT